MLVEGSIPEAKLQFEALGADWLAIEKVWTAKAAKAAAQFIASNWRTRDET
jgi:hypothetical protein